MGVAGAARASEVAEADCVVACKSLWLELGLWMDPSELSLRRPHFSLGGGGADGGGAEGGGGGGVRGGV